MALVPMVIESGPNGERAMDIGSRLLRDRIIMLNTKVDEVSASLIVQQMLFLESESSDPIHFYVTSGGGSVYHGMTIYDTMQFMKAPVYTYANGIVASMASLLSQAGEPGHRYMMPHARHMIHQVSSGTQGTAMDMEIAMKETLTLNNQLTQIYVDHNTKNRGFDELKKDMSRDYYMSAQEAIEYGLADVILTKRA